MTDAEIVQTAMEVRCSVDSNPDKIDVLGRSFSVATVLSMVLRMRHLSHEVADSVFDGQNHYYVRLQDGRVLDATIDRFADALNREPTQAVYLGPPLVCHNAA